MIGILNDSDSEDELPPGWEEMTTANGNVYYVNHYTKGTQWTHPRTGRTKTVEGELPSGWERRVAEDGQVLFVDHINHTTTYTDPRLAFATEYRELSHPMRQRFDGSSTALSVLHGRDLRGKIAIVTGANTGIGFETARSLALHGCTVIIACRDLKKGTEAVEKIKQERENVLCETLHLDLSSLHSVREAAEKFKQKYRTLHILILNAGVFAIPYQLTKDGYETTFQVNHLSQFYFTLLLEHPIRSCHNSRVVVVSSESHRFSSLRTVEDFHQLSLSPPAYKYWFMGAYNNSKLCNILFAQELAKYWPSVNVFSCHPGNMVSSSLSRYSWTLRPNNRLSHLTEKIKKEKQKEYKNPRPAFDVTSRRCKAKNQVRPIIYTNFLLRCLIDSIAVCLRDSPAITSITIDGIPLTLKYLNILCSGLKTNEKLISLSLKKCYIGDFGCDLLLNCLKNNPKLSVLNLSSCKLSSRSAMSLSLFLKRRKADLLQNIWEQSSEENTEKLQGLHTLILNQNPKIEDTGLKQIIYALKNDVWLKTLSLKRCGISKLGAEMMIRLLQSNNRIMRLDLTKNHIPINTLQIMLSILKKRQEISEKTVLNKQFCLNWRKNVKNEIIKFAKRHRKYSKSRIERPRKSSLQKHYWKKSQRFERFIREKQVKGITKEDYYRRKKINDLELQLLNLIESNSKLKEELSSNKALLNSEVQQRSKIENELQRISFRLNDLKSKVFMLNCISSKACNESQLLTGFKYIFEKLESFSMLKQNVSVNEEVDLETVEPLWSSPLAEQMENCVLNCSQWKPYFISH